MIQCSPAVAATLAATKRLVEALNANGLGLRYSIAHVPHWLQVNVHEAGHVSVAFFIGKSSGLVYAADGYRRGDRIGLVSKLADDAAAEIARAS